MTTRYYGVALLQKQDVAARRIGKLINLTELHDNLKAQYKAGSEKLVAWTAEKIAHLQGPARAFDNTLKGIQSKLATFNDYKKTEKAQRIGDLLDLESLFQNISARLKHNNRPPYQPGDNLVPTGLNAQFAILEKTELETAAAYATELSRQLHLHKVADSFKRQAQKLMATVNEHKTYFQAAEKIDTVESAEEALTTFAQEHSEFENTKNTRLQDLGKLVAELEKENFEDLATIKKLNSELHSSFDSTGAAAQSKKSTLEAAHKQQLQINDDLCKNLSNLISEFKSWLAQKKAALDADKGTPLEKQLADVQAQEKETADSRLNAIKEAEDKVVARHIVANPYTNVSHSDCSANFAQFGLTLKKKRELVESQIEDAKKAGLTDEQLQEIRDNFNYFDR